MQRLKTEAKTGAIYLNYQTSRIPITRQSQRELALMLVDGLTIEPNSTGPQYG